MSRLDKSVLEAIEKRGLSPRPPIYFLARRSILWTLAGLSILLGAISVAVGVFAVADFAGTGGRNFDEMPFDDLATGLPFLWLAVFALFVVSAFLALSRTKRGYRYHPMHIVAAVAAVSLLLGMILHVFDVGRFVHRYLSAEFSAYQAFTYIPYDEWRRPDKGYLGGEALSEIPGKSLRIRDFDGRIWEIDITTAVVTFSGSAVEEGDVAIRGKRTGQATFKAHSIEEFD